MNIEQWIASLRTDDPVGFFDSSFFGSPIAKRTHIARTSLKLHVETTDERKWRRTTGREVGGEKRLVPITDPKFIRAENMQRLEAMRSRVLRAVGKCGEMDVLRGIAAQLEDGEPA